MPEPIDPAALEDIRRLCAEIDHLRKQLAELLSRYAINADTDSIRESLQDAEAKARQKAEEALQFALARVKHRDDQYIFMRAIDGDTIEVEPPNELKKWMRDIHVRLYGIDTPESNQEHGPHYTRILDQLCNINQRRLRIVWERERKGTEYEGFPLGTFERDVGNVFVDLPDGNLLYVNAVLASLPHVTIERNSQPLLKGARHVRHLIEDIGPLRPHFFWPHRRWPTHRWMDLLHLISEGSKDIREGLFPYSPSRWWFGVPWVLPGEVAIESGSAISAFQHVMQPRLSECGCPECKRLLVFIESELSQYIEQERVSVFDLLIEFAHGWSL